VPPSRLLVEQILRNEVIDDLPWELSSEIGSQTGRRTQIGNRLERGTDAVEELRDLRGIQRVDGRGERKRVLDRGPKAVQLGRGCGKVPTEIGEEVEQRALRRERGAKRLERQRKLLSQDGDRVGSSHDGGSRRLEELGVAFDEYVEDGRIRRTRLRVEIREEGSTDRIGGIENRHRDHVLDARAETLDL
jgi:hypothetical protein